jgi:hypothetical protein
MNGYSSARYMHDDMRPENPNVIETGEGEGRVCLTDAELNTLAGYAPVNRWQYVADGNPGKNEWLLVSRRYGENSATLMLYWTGRHWENDEGLVFDSVYAYRPLPSPAPLREERGK